MKKENTVAEGIVLLHNPKMWNGEFKSPIDWHVPLQNRNGIWLKQRAFFLRTGGGKDTEHGIFAAGIVIAPPPDANTDGLPPPLFWYPDPANPGKESPHVNVQVDIPSTFLAGGCEESNPVLVPSDVLGTEAPFRNFAVGRSKALRKTVLFGRTGPRLRSRASWNPCAKGVGRHARIFGADAHCRHSGIFIPRGRDVKYPKRMQSRGMKISGISRASGAGLRWKLPTACRRRFRIFSFRQRQLADAGVMRGRNENSGMTTRRAMGDSPSGAWERRPPIPPSPTPPSTSHPPANTRYPPSQ